MAMLILENLIYIYIVYIYVYTLLFSTKKDTFIQQACFKLIRSNSNDIYNVSKKSFTFKKLYSTKNLEKTVY